MTPSSDTYICTATFRMNLLVDDSIASALGAERVSGRPGRGSEQDQVLHQETLRVRRQVGRGEQEAEGDYELDARAQTADGREPRPPVTDRQEHAQEQLDDANHIGSSLNAGDGVQPAQEWAVPDPWLNGERLGLGELGQAPADEKENESVAQDRGADELEWTGAERNAMGCWSSFASAGGDHCSSPPSGSAETDERRFSPLLSSLAATEDCW